MTTPLEATVDMFGRTPRIEDPNRQRIALISIEEFGSDPDFFTLKECAPATLLFIVRDKEDLKTYEWGVGYNILYLDENSDCLPDFLSFYNKRYGDSFKLTFGSCVIYFGKQYGGAWKEYPFVVQDTTDQQHLDEFLENY